MSNIFNFKDPLRTGFVKIVGSGLERYGTVVKSGLNKKTCTVRSDSYFMKPKFHKKFIKSTNFHCHDEDMECRVGDKVIIRRCEKLSKIKNYYVKRFVWMAPRIAISYQNLQAYEKKAIMYNDKLRENTELAETI